MIHDKIVNKNLTYLENVGIKLIGPERWEKWAQDCKSMVEKWAKTTKGH